jgi:teichuronic acid biosynthesis glycosyltransferase TuaC
MHILTLTTLFPNAMQPHHAVFVRTRMEHFTRARGHRWTVVAPVPYFPKLPFGLAAKYDAMARVPKYEDSRGYPVYHPRYFVTPKVGMVRGVRRLIRRLHSDHPFDVIDGHYIYPDGTAATKMGEEMGLPVVLSARGSDLNLYPRLPGIAPLIRANIESCRALICVSESLKRVALALGAEEGKVRVIGNGINGDRFHSGDRLTARREVGLPLEATVILSVGRICELKGFHLLIQACAAIDRADLLLVIVGEGEERRSLERLVAECNLGGRVIFAGAIPNEDLPLWYQSADFFVLASSREGWPNVLCEAQACGLPAVATRVGGIPEIVSDGSLGVLVHERSEEGLSAGLKKALSRSWDRAHIEATGRSRTWEHVTQELAAVFEGLT